MLGRITKGIINLNLNILSNNLNHVRNIRTGGVVMHEIADRNWSYKTLPQRETGTDGERTADIDSMINKRESMFPTTTSHLRIFDGIPYEQLPIINIKSTKNNTIMNVTDAKGVSQCIRSCGIEGFKKCRKGTNVAAQATATTFAQKVIEKGLKTVRVRVAGLGAGRMSSIKGLQLGGINIVSITDNTRISWNPPRPRKARRV